MMSRNTFRMFERQQDELIRATMPRVAAADPVQVEQVVRQPRPERTARTLTFKLAEVR